MYPSPGCCGEDGEGIWVIWLLKYEVSTEKLDRGTEVDSKQTEMTNAHCRYYLQRHLNI